jgi:integrase
MIRKNTYRTGEWSLTQKEYDKILDVCQSIEEELLIKLAVSTGLRREDIVNIEIDNIDLKNNRLRFVEKKKRLYVGGPSKIRDIPLGPKLTQLINKHIRTVDKDQTKLFSFKGRTAFNRLQELCDRAEIERRPFHALRATCVKFCQKAGWSPEEVCALTGDTLSVIQKHYAVPSETEMKEAATTKEII